MRAGQQQKHSVETSAPTSPSAKLIADPFGERVAMSVGKGEKRMRGLLEHGQGRKIEGQKKPAGVLPTPKDTGAIGHTGHRFVHLESCEGRLESGVFRILSEARQHLTGGGFFR